MRSYLSPGKFFQKMKKKPAVQAVIDNLQNYTDEDIDKLSGTHFPHWIRDEIKELKKRNGSTAEDMANIIAQKMIEASRVDK